jgi:LPS-assembly protein
MHRAKGSEVASTILFLCTVLLAGPGAADSQAVEEPAQETPPAAAPPAAPAPPSAEPLEEPPPGRTTFQLPVPADQGGGTIAGSAGSIEFLRDDYAVLAGGVELRYQDVVVKAERIEADLETQVVKAEGDVVIDQGSRRIAGATATYDLTTRTGTFTDATAYADPDIYFSGAELAKVGENTYTVVDGIFTSCSDEVPDWSFRLRRARVEVEGYAHVRGAALRVKRVPVLYFPYVLWPAKTERSSGLLVPQPGYSRRRGPSLSLAYFQTLGRSYDTTLFTDLYTERSFQGIGNELRWAPSAGSKGQLLGYIVRDPDSIGSEEDGLPDWRWKVNLDHESTDLPFGLRGVVSFRDYSDFDYFRDFERDVDRASIRSIYSNGFLAGAWGHHSLNVLVEDRQTLETLLEAGQPPRDVVVTQRRLPDVRYRLRSTQLGRMPLYLDLDGSLSYLDVEGQGDYQGSYGRLDLFPNLAVPLSKLDWLAVRVSGGYRYTWYGDSVCRTAGEGAGACDERGRRFVGESLSRGIPAAGAEIEGPSFSRIFDAKLGPFGKLKHVVKPRFVYSYLGEVDQEDLDRTPVFDGVDRLGATDVGTLSLINTLYAKPADGKGATQRLVLFELAQSYSFDPEVPLLAGEGREKRYGPISGSLLLEPSRGTSLEARVLYDTLFKDIRQRSLSGTVGLGPASFRLNWTTRYNLATDAKAEDVLRLWTTWRFKRPNLHLESHWTYDLRDDPNRVASKLQQQTYALLYTSQCYSLRLEAREFRDLDGQGDERRDRDYRLLLSLKNVGTFLDVSGRQSTADEY